jgi:hypothetical protein
VMHHSKKFDLLMQQIYAALFFGDLTLFSICLMQIF